MRLSDEELDLIQAYVDSVRTHAAALGFSMTLSSDANAFVDFLHEQEGTHGVSSIHDPAKCHITPDNFAWFRVDRYGVGVACHAIRSIETDDFIEEVRTHRVFGDIEVPWDFENVGLYPEAYDLRFAGRIGMGGGLWIHPNCRGQNLSSVFSKLLRIIGIRRFRLDHYVSFVLNTGKRQQWSLQSNGQARIPPLLNGYYPPYGTKKDILLTHCTRDEMLMQIRQELAVSEAAVSASHTEDARQPMAERA